MKIAIFDSGFGGLSVLNFALKQIPNEQFLYYADSKNVPYGTKTREEILKFSHDAVEFLIKHDAKAIVIACNTATSAAINELRAKFDLPIIGMEPAVKKAIDEMRYGKNTQNITQNNMYLNPNSRTLVIATPLTVKGAKLKELIKRVNADEYVDLLALPRLVEFAQNENFNGAQVKEYMQSQLAKFELANFSSLVLGCTHFNYFKDVLREILPPQVAIIDGISGTVNKLISELKRLNLCEQNMQNVEFFYSGESVKEQSELNRIKRYLSRLEEMAKIG